MKLQLIRHATLLLQFRTGIRLLVDPMLGDAGCMPPIANSTNDRRNPLVPLPVPLEELLDVEAVLLTHSHRDHFDETALTVLPKDVPVFCQPEDEGLLVSRGFTAVHPVVDETVWNDIRLIRTGGRHGTGEIGERMGPVSGYGVLCTGEPTLYIAGDTIYCPEVEWALETLRPDVAVLNTGAAQFAQGDPITMTATDVATVCASFSSTYVIAVHMDAINHCLLTRADLQNAMQQANLQRRVEIPADGEVIDLS